MAKSQKTNSYICKNCHVELQQNMTCVCCNRHMQKHLCKMYNKLNYDFTNFVVSLCLQHASHALHDDQYICSSCNKTLKETSDENPVVPFYARYTYIVTGTNFLKALHQRPEYVCTCCHCMLFHKTVQQFHIKDYDITNETVKASLSHRYVMKLHRHTSHENDDMTTHKWPQFVPGDVKQNDIYVMNEYICIWCRNSLQQKNTKMPDQACGNGLQLHDMPQDL